MKMGSLRLGFVALSDCAPFAAALELGLFEAEGLDVILSREVSWATIRDKVAAGALDGAQMLAPMAVAASLGIGVDPAPLVAPLVTSREGASITVSRTLADHIDRVGLREVLAERRSDGHPPIALSVVFPYSLHYQLLREWLTRQGVDPNIDVSVGVTPPARMAERLVAGEIEGFCVGEPWAAAAIDSGAGVTVARASALCPGRPDKVFSTSERWATQNPESLQALMVALLRAGKWVARPENHAGLAVMLARTDYVRAPAELIRRTLGEIVFDRSTPSAMDIDWIVDWMTQGPANAIATREAVATVLRSDLGAPARSKVLAPD